MHDTWTVRDLPVLEATVSLLEQSYMVTVTDIAARTGLEAAQVARALEALDPMYVDFRKTTTGGDPRFWYVFKATPAARQVVGQWPTAESLIDALADQLYAASHLETGDERQSLLAYAARLIGDTVRDLAVAAAAQVLQPALGDVTLPEPEPLPGPPAAGQPVAESAGQPVAESAGQPVAESAGAEPGSAESAGSAVTAAWPPAAWPPDADSAETGPVAGRPPAAETGPVAGRPPETQPAEAEPAETGPSGTGPVVADHDMADRGMADRDTADQELAEPDATSPDLAPLPKSPFSSFLA